MGLEKLGNPTLQKQGTQTSSQVHDGNTHELLLKVLVELKVISLCLGQMSDIDTEELTSKEILR